MAAQEAISNRILHHSGLHPLQQSGGFTLVEILITLVIVGVLAVIALPQYGNAIDRSRVTTAIGDISRISADLQRYHTLNFGYPASLSELGLSMDDPWGSPYEYLPIPEKGFGKVRKNKNLVPINSDFDLYSKGKDGASVSPLTAKASQDDIVRAGNGSFVGLVSDY